MPAVNLKAAGMKAKPRRTSNGGCKRGFRHNDFRSSFDHPEESWGLAVFRGQGSDFGRHGLARAMFFAPKGHSMKARGNAPGNKYPGSPALKGRPKNGDQRSGNVGGCRSPGGVLRPLQSAVGAPATTHFDFAASGWTVTSHVSTTSLYATNTGSAQDCVSSLPSLSSLRCLLFKTICCRPTKGAGSGA